MNSSIITPVRIYTDIFESDRFSSECDICRFELISDKTRLLPFQFRRPRSPYLIDKWFLRRECEDPMVGLLNNNDSLFTIDTSYWSKSNFSFTNGKLKSTNLICQFEKLFIFQDTFFYGVKIVISDLQTTGSFTVKGRTNARDIAIITEPGTYYYEFQANSSDDDFSFFATFANANDYVIVEQVQIYKYQGFNTTIGDIDLDKTLLSLVNINTNDDLIQYCGNNLPIQIPCGKYYMVLVMEDNSTYYSELITVKDFIPSRSPYTMIEWTNSCDLSDVIYQEIDGCSFKNRMYIDAELLKPEYPFREEGEEDGEFKVNIMFQKWEKKQALMVAKCPEFIVDALTAMRLHDTITITKRLRKKQIHVLDEIEVEKVECINSSVFSDCATNVELNILLKDKIVDSTCCKNIDIATCVECEYTVSSLDVLTGSYYFGTHGGDYGLFFVEDGVYTNISGDKMVVCVTDSGLKYLNYGGEFWTPVPHFSTATTETSTKYTVSGYAYENTYIKITINFFDEFTSLISSTTLPTIYTSAQFFAGIDILKSDVSFPCPLFGTAEIFVESFSLNCNYGNSETFIFDYALHPLLQDWYDALTVKPSCELLFDLNQLVKGLDTDGNLNEFDLLHMMAGLETDEQRLLPLFTSSGSAFSAINSVTMNQNGIKGNGIDSYIDTNWSIDANANFYTQNSCSIIIKSKHPSPYNGVAIGTTESTTNSRSLIKFGAPGGSTSTVDADLNSNGTSPGLLLNQSVLFTIIRNSNANFTSYYNGVAYNNFIRTSIATSNMVNNMTIGALNNDSGPSDFSPATYQFVYIGSGLVDHVKINNRVNLYLLARGI